MEPININEQKPDCCPHCGAQMPQNMVQCPKCGKRVTFAGVKTSHGKGTAILISAIVMIAIIFIALAVSGVFKGTPVESYLSELESEASSSTISQS